MEANPHYWLGYLRASLDIIARDHAGTPVGREARRSVREYDSAPLPHRDRKIVAYALLDATDEVYAIRGTQPEIEQAKADAIDYLDGAARCGHPSAPSWAAERLPFTVLTVTEEERIEMLEEGTPTLDREP